MTGAAPAYGLWFLVVVNSAVFILFAFSFFKPRTRRDWRPFGVKSCMFTDVRNRTEPLAAKTYTRRRRKALRESSPSGPVRRSQVVGALPRERCRKPLGKSCLLGLTFPAMGDPRVSSCPNRFKGGST